MSLTSRFVTNKDYEPDGVTPATGKFVIYRLARDGYTSEATVPKGEIRAEIDDAANSAARLWCNTESLKETWWEFTLPDGTSGTFHVPVGTTPISLEYLRSQEDIYGWDPPEQGDVEAIVDGIFAAFANTADVALGDGLVGTKNSGTGATATTVHAKLGQMFFISDYDTFADAVTAAAGETLVVNTSVSVPASMTVPATVGLCVEYGGLLTVASGQTLTINSSLIAGRYQIFTGSGTVAGAPQIDFSCPEWFGAAGVSATTDTLACHKALAFYPHITGVKTTRYKITSAREQHTTTDIYSFGRVQDYRTRAEGGNRVIQLPNGVCFGVRIPTGGIVEDCNFELTTSGFSAQKLHAGFVTGDPQWGLTTAPDAQRVDDVTFRRNTVTVASDAPIAPYRTTLAERVPAGDVTLVLAASTDFTRIIPTEQIRVNMDDGSGGTEVFFGTVQSVDTPTRTVTMTDGLTLEASAGNVVRGPFVAPIATFIAQSSDGLVFSDNILDSDGLVGMYGFDCHNPHIERNKFFNAEKLAALDYCHRIQFNHNVAYNSNQLLDLNKACKTVTIIGNQYDRFSVFTEGDAIIELNGAQGVVAKGNIFKRGTRAFIVNNKGLVYNTWRDMMRQNFEVSEAAWIENKANSYFATWKNVTLKGNRYEWIQRCSHYIGDSWKVFTDERIEFPETTCGTDLEIDDTAINCSSYPFFNRFNGVVQAMEGKQLRIKMHIDNPDAVRTWTSGAVAADQRTITVTEVSGVTITDLLDQPIRIVLSDTDEDSAAIYLIEDIVDNGATWTITTQRDITVGTNDGMPVWIGPGNSCGISVRSWTDDDHWNANINFRTSVSTTAAAGQPTIVIPDPGVATTSLIDLRITVTHDNDTEESYVIQSAVDNGATFTLTTANNLLAQASAGQSVVILGMPVVRTATEASTRSDCELLHCSGYVANVASQGFFAYRPRIVHPVELTIENCGSRDRTRYAALVIEPEVREARTFGSINIDNESELNEAGNAELVDYGFAVNTSTGDLNDATIWSTSKPFLDLRNSRIVGHATRDLELSDDVKTQEITVTGTSGTYTVSDGVTTSAALAFNASAGTVQTEVRAFGGEFAAATVTLASGVYAIRSTSAAVTLTIDATGLSGGTATVAAITPMFAFARVDPWTNTIPVQRFTSGYRIPFSVQKDFGTQANNGHVTVTHSVVGARKGDIVEFSYTNQRFQWRIVAGIYLNNTLFFDAVNQSGASDTMSGGVLQGWVQKL